jgi:2-oxoglutarate dehydrogenase complex dehydrogenase (E1) component-like enzyme
MTATSPLMRVNMKKHKTVKARNTEFVVESIAEHVISFMEPKTINSQVRSSSSRNTEFFDNPTKMTTISHVER